MSTQIKRFYTSVEMVQNAKGFAVELDGRPIKSAGQQTLLLPNISLALQIVDEWRQQDETIDFATMPVTRFASAVHDTIMPRPDGAREEILKYAHSDLLCYRVGEPEALIDRQKERWDPIMDRFKTEHKIEFITSIGIQYIEQNSDAMNRFGALIDPLRDYQLGSVHLVTVMTGSALLAMALYQGWLAPTTVWELAHLDEDFQAEQWGEDDEASLRRAQRFSEFRAATLVFTR